MHFDAVQVDERKSLTLSSVVSQSLAVLLVVMQKHTEVLMVPIPTPLTVAISRRRMPCSNYCFNREGCRA